MPQVLTGLCLDYGDALIVTVCRKTFTHSDGLQEFEQINVIFLEKLQAAAGNSAQTGRAHENSTATSRVYEPADGYAHSSGGWHLSRRAVLLN